MNEALPTIGAEGSVKNGVLGGWQISSIIQARTGNALVISQPSGISRSRPDVVAGQDLIVADWRDTCSAAGCNYLNTAGFALVPVAGAANATVRPGTYMLDMARGPGTFNAHMTVAKSFGLGAGRRLQVRIESFNVLNRPNYYIQNAQLATNNANFGRITSATPPGATTGARVFQLGGRLTF
jgi:hypothetical protein